VGLAPPNLYWLAPKFILGFSFRLAIAGKPALSLPKGRRNTHSARLSWVQPKERNTKNPACPPKLTGEGGAMTGLVRRRRDFIRRSFSVGGLAPKLARLRRGATIGLELTGPLSCR